MLDENTICYKVSKSVEIVERAIKTKEFDIGIVKYLHAIRQDAQRMEKAIKVRKQIMIAEGIEEKYQNTKSDFKSSAKINNLQGQDQETQALASDKFSVTIKKNNEILYDNEEVIGCAICCVEKITEIDPEGSISGEQQVFVYGHDLVKWYAFDQLRQAIEGKTAQIMAAIRTALETGMFVRPDLKKRLIEGMNKQKKI